ncbi:MAG: GNAT family N-acetyltransferase [Marmoricola sp.]
MDKDAWLGDQVRVLPANQVSWDDLRAIFGTRGSASVCWCQRYKLSRRESFASVPEEVRADRLREQTGCGDAGGGAEQTNGLVAQLDGQPVGWCAVEPRPAYFGLLANFRVPWEGRDEDKGDDSVWAVTCVLTRAGFRRRGVSRALISGAVDHARECGARAIEGYPMTTNKAIAEELHVGSVAGFAAAGLREVSRPSQRRAVMRLEF